MRKIKFANGEYYHIYNRGVDKRDIFGGEKDYLRFLTITREFNSTEVIGGLHMKYLKDKNKKYNRSGTLFQGKFKSIHIDTNEYLLWLSGYINGNAEIHKIAEAENYKWSSYQDYLRKRNGTLCNKEIILSQFGNIEEYKKYVEMVIRESRNRKDMEKYFIEEEIKSI